MYLTRERERLLIIGISLVVCLILLSSTILFYEKIRITNVISTEVKEIESIKQEYYVLKEDMLKGTVLKNENFVKEEFDSLSVHKDVVNRLEDLTGKVLLVDMPKNATILRSMLVNYDNVITADLRRINFDSIIFPSDLKKNQFIDVVFQDRTGKEYVVLSKKEITDLVGNNIWMNLDNIETIFYNDAFLEAMKEKTGLYSRVYVDSLTQPAAEITYKLKVDNLEFLKNNPNVDKELLLELIDKQKQIGIYNNQEHEGSEN